ncbi:hypothetical protein GCM10023092_03560 [Rurimicrobium arvi]|uniref:Glycosyltransferase subfamily 4-like N-terminal domain-containing protein n=1 Tax=Rurimicrobium arvi TaxID=2049916 RepID=A0ABP8MEP8_9BACT
MKDGGALAMYAMIQGWQEQGWEVHVLAMNTSRHRVAHAQLPELFRQIASFEMVDVDTDIRWSRVFGNLMLSRKPEHAQRFFKKEFARRLKVLVQQVRPALIQFESIYLHEYMPELRRISGDALIVQRLHNVEHEIWARLARQTTGALKKAYLENLARRIAVYERQVWSECDAVIPITQKDADYIRHSNIDTPQIVIPYGMHWSDTESEIPGGRWKAYHIGAMDWKPNAEAMDWMRDAIVPAVQARVKEFTFDFAGRSMPERFLNREQSSSFNCCGEVADAQAFIADKQILIVPLKSGSGLRVKTLEAMAAGKLVISTSVGIQGIDALDNIHFLKADTASEFADKLEWVMQHPQAAQRIVANAKDLLRAHHSLPALMQQLSVFTDTLFVSQHKKTVTVS